MLLGHPVFEQEAPDLYGGFAAVGRGDEERADEAALAVLRRIGLADGLAARGAVKAHAYGLVARPLVAEDVLAGRHVEAADAQRRLRDEEVRVLALGRIAGGNHHDSGDEAPAPVRHARSGAKLRLDILFENRRACGDDSPQLVGRRRTPARARDRGLTGDGCEEDDGNQRRLHQRRMFHGAFTLTD